MKYAFRQVVPSFTLPAVTDMSGPKVSPKDLLSNFVICQSDPRGRMVQCGLNSISLIKSKVEILLISV